MNSQLWANTAIDNELSALAKMPEGTNINKPGSLLYVSLLKIASIVKGGYVPEHDALDGVKKSLCAFTWIPQKEIDYQWERAYRKAGPRHPTEQNRLPTAKKKKTVAGYIQTYDTKTGKTGKRPFTPQIASKAAEMAGQIRAYVSHGEIKKSNMMIETVCMWPKKVDLILRFPRYTAALHDCVIVACGLLNGGLSDAQRNGRFEVIIPLDFGISDPP